MLGGEKFLNLFFPPRCTGCDFYSRAGNFWCVDCEAQTAGWGQENLHGRHLFFAKYYQQTEVERAIFSLKYNGVYDAARDLAGWWRAVWPALTALAPAPYWLVPVPLHARRQSERGFNQTELLARAWAEISGAQVWNELRRTRYTAPQAHSDRATRLTQLQDCFAATQIPPSGTLILIDDVVTTGATLKATAAALTAAVNPIVYLALARAT